MVDPNRKINRLTERDIEFLEECEQEFSSRYAEDDVEFMEHCLKPLDDPPIIENWNIGGYDFTRNEGGARYHNRVGNRNERNLRNNFRHQRGGRDHFKDHRPSFKQEGNSTSSRPPMYIRRDYKNFVAASKDD